jgi:hypothetical protein
MEFYSMDGLAFLGHILNEGLCLVHDALQVHLIYLSNQGSIHIHVKLLGATLNLVVWLW